MGHSILFDDFDRIDDQMSRGEIVDIIELFYKWGDTNFQLVCQEDSETATRGVHVYLPLSRKHVITLSRSAIERGYLRKITMGGNRPAPSLRMGIAMVLTHEVQHANQAGLHVKNEQFYTHHEYYTRPCEREARRFVDENVELLAGILGEDRSRKRIMISSPGDDVQDVAELFRNASRVTVKDLREELRLSGLSSPKNVQTLSRMLRESGVIICHDDR